jgi:hypothetical protein
MFKNPDSRRDFSFTIDVTLTKRDLDHGISRRPESCPVARQLTRDIKRRFRRWNVRSVEVGNAFVTVKVSNAKGRETYELAAGLEEGVSRLVHRIDDNEEGILPGGYGTLVFRYNRTFYGDQA